MIRRKIRMGMVGGGPGAFILVRFIVWPPNSTAELSCGAFSSDRRKSRRTGRNLFLAEHHVYASYQEMITREKKLPEGERIDFVSIVTPNFMHYPVAKMALENGFHVICDKPMTFDLKQAKALERLVKKSGLLFGLTHNYTGYPMVKEARALIQKGKMARFVRSLSPTRKVGYPRGSKPRGRNRPVGGPIPSKRGCELLHGRYRYACGKSRGIYNRIAYQRTLC